MIRLPKPIRFRRRTDDPEKRVYVVGYGSGVTYNVFVYRRSNMPPFGHRWKDTDFLYEEKLTRAEAGRMLRHWHRTVPRRKP